MRTLRTACLLLVLTLASTAHAIDYYIATWGSDGNDCSSARPCQSIGRGVGRLRAGDTLVMRGGTWADALNTNAYNIPSGTSWTSPTTIRSAPGESVWLRPGGGDAVINVVGEGRRYIVIDGVNVDAAGTNFGISSGGGADNIRYQNLEVTNARYSAVITHAAGSNGHQFIRLHVHHNGTGTGDHGFYIQTKYTLIEDCDVHDNSGYGVHVYNGYSAPSERADYSVIRNNRLYNAGGNGYPALGGMVLTSASYAEAYNNLIYNNQGDGLGLYWGKGCYGCKIFHNTVYGNSGYGLIMSEKAVNSQIRNNVFVQNGVDWYDYGSSGTVASHNWRGSNGDPRLRNPGGGDFRPAAGSPLIDTGVTLSSVRYDFARTPRPQGARSDIGAYEFGR